MSSFKYSSLDYDAYYDNEHCKRENAAIREVFNRFIADGCSVLDLGAGTGLVSALLTRKAVNVIQVESDPKMCEKNPYHNMINHKAEKYLNTAIRFGLKYDYITCVFALNYMNPLTVLKTLPVFRSLAIFLVYKNPYLTGSTSYYAGRKALFYWRCGLKQLFINLLFRLLHRRIIKRFNLLGEDYYEVVIMR